MLHLSIQAETPGEFIDQLVALAGALRSPETTPPPAAGARPAITLVTDAAETPETAKAKPSRKTGAARRTERQAAQAEVAATVKAQLPLPTSTGPAPAPVEAPKAAPEKPKQQTALQTAGHAFLASKGMAPLVALFEKYSTPDHPIKRLSDVPADKEAAFLKELTAKELTA